jgi:hypothetical protein
MSGAGTGSEPLQVRWLSALCGRVPDWPLPQLSSRLLSAADSAQVASYIARWARNPDPGSNFARAAGAALTMPDAQLAAALRARGYDGLLYFAGDEIVGHLFFQWHDSEVHAFSVWIAERHRGENLTVVTVFDLLAHVSASAGIKRVRCGRGRVVGRLLAPLQKISATLRWRVHADGSVEFAPDEARRSPEQR